VVLPIEVPAHSGGETTLYRLVQGALANAVEHSKAQPVDSHKWRNYVLFCLIRDDGRGFDRSQATHGRKGLGLMAIRGTGDCPRRNARDRIPFPARNRTFYSALIGGWLCQFGLCSLMIMCWYGRG
jgi:hypothetical protein